MIVIVLVVGTVAFLGALAGSALGIYLYGRSYRNRNRRRRRRVFI
jgi:hypothetical protein